MFNIAGKWYRNEKNLLYRAEYEYEGEWLYPGCKMMVYRDVYGRRVLHLSERFPCFDSWDYLCEKRFYHWYFVVHETGVAMVYAEDERKGLEIVKNIDMPDREGRRVTENMRREIMKSGMLNRV